MNVAGCYLKLREKASRRTHEAILWGRSQAPFVVEIDGRRWGVQLRHRRWRLPFTVVLDDFRRDLHPGTMDASTYQSDVTTIEHGVEQQVNISMNRPLRHEGYTLFQSSWGPSDARPGARLFSTFSVARNPSDQWPLVACIVIAAGLLLHFSRRLLRYVKAEVGAQRS